MAGKHDSTVVNGDEEPGHQSQSQAQNTVTGLGMQLEKLRHTGKIERAAFLDLNGKPLARTSGMDISSDDGAAIVLALQSTYRHMVKMKVGKLDFTCLRNTSTSFVGRTDTDFVCIYQGKDLIVVGISDPESRGSSIYEVTRFLAQRDRDCNYIAEDGVP